METIIKNLPWHYELNLLLKVVLSFIAGGAIGLEREKVGKEAGIRTFGFICTGACAYTVLADIFSPIQQRVLLLTSLLELVLSRAVLFIG